MKGLSYLRHARHRLEANCKDQQAPTQQRGHIALLLFWLRHLRAGLWPQNSIGALVKGQGW